MTIVWTLVSSLLFATMSLLVKTAASEFPLPTMVFCRALPGALLLLGYALLRGLPIRTSHWKMHLARNAVGLASMVLAFYAVSRLPLATASCLDYTAPIFMTLFAVLTLRQRPTIIETLALSGGFVGVLLLLRPTAQHDQIVPFLAGLASGALAAVVFMQVRSLGRSGEPPWRIVMIYSITTLFVSGLAMPFAPMPTTYSWRGVAALAGIGITGLFAQLAMTRAYSEGSPTLVATLQYSTVVFSAVYGYALWDDRFSITSLSGLALVVVSGALVAWHVRTTGAAAQATTAARPVATA